MKKTIAKSMTAIVAVAMITEDLTACGDSDNKAETTAAIEIAAEATEAVEKTATGAAGVKESTEATSAEEFTEAADTKEFVEAAGTEEFSEVDGTGASKEDAASEANAKAAEETTEVAQS